MTRRGSKKEKRTLKQSKLVQALPTSKSGAEAGEKAGCAHRQDAHRALKSIDEKAPEVLERLGLTIDYVADKCLRPLLEAKETKFFANQGAVMEQRDVEALDIRLRAIDTWAKLMGAYTRPKVEMTGSLGLDFNHVTDDELEAEIANLLKDLYPPEKA